MIQDCRADKPEGWRYFISNDVPLIRKLLMHYDAAAAPAVLERVLVATRKPESSLFQSIRARSRTLVYRGITDKSTSGTP